MANTRREAAIERIGDARAPMRLGSVTRTIVGGLAAWLPALPLILLTGAMLIAPAIALVVRSFHTDTGSFTLANWTETLRRPSEQRAIITSLKIGAVCATLSLLIGGPLAWLISRMATAKRSTWLALLNVAANFGGIGLAFAFVATLGSLGMVTLAFANLHFPFRPPDPGTFWGLVIGYEYTNIPLFVLLTMPAMSILRADWWEAAQTSGATRAQFWHRIGIPVLTPFLGAGWLLIFTWSVGIYGLAFALAGATAGTGIRLITLEIGNILQASVFGQQRADVLAVILLLLATISLVTYRLILRWALRWFS